MSEASPDAKETVYGIHSPELVSSEEYEAAILRLRKFTEISPGA